MQVRQTNKDTTARMWIPARDFLAILKCCVQNIGGAAPNMGMVKGRVIATRVGPNFTGCKAIMYPWGVVVKVQCIGLVKWPQNSVFFIRPTKGSIKNEDACLA